MGYVAAEQRQSTSSRKDTVSLNFVLANTCNIFCNKTAIVSSKRMNEFSAQKWAEEKHEEEVTKEEESKVLSASCGL